VSRIINLEEILQQRRLERIMIYGKPKTGKTRLVGALPRNEKWGEILYVACDRNSELLPSIIDRTKIHVVKPGPAEGQTHVDLLEDLVEIFTKDWKAEYPGVGTIVVDTGTVMTGDLMQFYVDTKKVQENHKKLGREGTKSYHAQADKGDFGGAQSSHGFLLDHLWLQPLHLVVLYHEDWVEPKSGGLDELTGGPMTVGIAQIRTLPGRFDTVLRTVSNIGAARFAVQTERQGAWPAEVRQGNVGLRLGQSGHYALADDPRSFWEDFDLFVEGKGPAVVLNSGAKKTSSGARWT
jgi:hypothetical protein